MMLFSGLLGWIPPGRSQEIDSTGTDGPDKGRKHSVFDKFEKGVNSACFAASGKDRPKEFAMKSGIGEFLHAWNKTYIDDQDAPLSKWAEQGVLVCRA